MKRTNIKNCLVIAALLALGGCGVIETLNGWMAIQTRIPDKTSVLVVPAPQLARDEEFDAHIKSFSLMALFAKVAYRQDIPEKTRGINGCAYLNGTPEYFGMPRHADGSGWSRLIVNTGRRDEPDEVVSCYDRHGLFFETYVHRPDALSRPDMIVIAIRGTENYNFYQFMRDWSSNLAAMFGFDPTEYRYARTMIVPLIKAIKADHGDVDIYLTGHSLGGGIAQQIAYISKDVKATFAFDSTPVTNWSHLVTSKPQLIPEGFDPIIIRVSHTNEFLQGPRTIVTRLTTTRINRSDYEFFFQKSGRISDHEMGILACNFALRIQLTGADFDLSGSFAQHVLRDPAICPIKTQKYYQKELILDWGGE